MQSVNSFQNVFGKADADFKNNVYVTLAKLAGDERKYPIRKMSLRAFAVAAVICTMLIGAMTALAFSNAWGIMDFFAGRIQEDLISPDAMDIVQYNPPQEGGLVEIVSPEETLPNLSAQNEKVEFTIREAVFDGVNVFIVVEARPTSPEFLVLGLDATESDYVGIADVTDKTFIRAYIRVPAGTTGGDFVIEDNGTFVFLLYFPYENDSPVINLELVSGIILDDPAGSEDRQSIDVEELRSTLSPEEFEERMRQERENMVAGDMEDSSVRIESILTVTIVNTGASSVSNVLPVYFMDCGIRVDSVILVGSEMSTYVRLEYTIIDDAVYSALDDGLSFEFLDENGDVITSGIAGGGTTPIDGSNKRFVWECSLRALETMPSKVTIRAFSIWDRTRYEAHVFELN